MSIDNAQARVVISGVTPEIEAGRFPVKRTVGEKLVVEADIFADGHDALAALLLYRAEHESQWRKIAMSLLVNDRWRGEFRVTALGSYLYTVQAWVDRFTSWRDGFRKKVAANQDVRIDVLVGADLLDAAAQRARGVAAAQLSEWSATLRSKPESATTIDLALADEVAILVAAHPDRQFAVTYERELRVVVDPEKARFSAWYELFPRSCASEAGRHGTFADCEKRLPYVAAMGFDVLYFPPIHPIGRTFRKGKNNALTTTAEDPGSPWAIGSSEGGHKAIHPQLGTLDDFRRLLRRAREHGLELALDLAYQCAPDHPYVKAHSQWFRHRPDGSIQYAENPPKKYQDIYPIDFETEDWRALWEELHSIVQFWIDQGVRIFRVDNPHTKSFRFWEWMIGEIRKISPEVIFLSEAFTRPKVRYRLAKLGFNQSYTYFAWRNTKAELTQYLTDLTQTEVREYFRPHLWPNTPDILTEYLQFGGRPAFIARLVLAATLGASYGIYGPAFELCENHPREAGGEEYLNSEKYEIRHWDLQRPESLKDIITRVNHIRRENPALHSNEGLQFHPIDNDQLICYSKHNEDGTNLILVVVNLDPHHTHAGWLELLLDEVGLTAGQPYQVHDLLSDARSLWQGARNYVQLDPRAMPAHIFRLRRRVHSERDFDYYM